MNWSEIFSDDFLDELTGSLTTPDILISLLLSFLLGLFIFFVYKRSFQGVMYSKTFNLALIALSMVSSTIILGVTTSVALSLGTLGALSIVRFRTAIKDPIDVVYMFWSIAIGIITGAGLYLLAVLASALIGAVLFLFSKAGTRWQPYLLVIHYAQDEVENRIFETLGTKVGTYKIKSKNRTPGSCELTVEIRAKGDQCRVVNTLGGLEGVTNVAMVSYDGEYAA
jgi:uncharacterized membrane protein YhiD involved in acid resistance